MKSKALLLLFIFLLNTAAGFACALRMSNHEHEEATEHQHEGDEASEHHHKGHRRVSQPLVNQQSALKGTYIAKNDPCCQGAVSNFNALVKIAPQSGYVILLAPFTYVGTSHQFFLKAIPESQLNQLVAFYERRRPPTHPIRIAIQSFQI